METYFLSLFKEREVKIDERALLYCIYFSRREVNPDDVSIRLVVKDWSSSWNEILETSFSWMRCKYILKINTTPKSYREVLEICKQFIFKELEFCAVKEIMAKKYCNIFCKIIASTDKKCTFSGFKFDWRVKLSKLFNSMCSINEIDLVGCNFDFEGELQIRKPTKYVFKFIWINNWTSSSHSFINLLKAFADIALSTEFNIEVWNLKLRIYDKKHKSFIEMLGLAVNLGSSWTKIIWINWRYHDRNPYD